MLTEMLTLTLAPLCSGRIIRRTVLAGVGLFLVAMLPLGVYVLVADHDRPDPDRLHLCNAYG